MALGKGQYDDQLTQAREAVKGEGGLLIIINGDKGSGFSCQLNPYFLQRVPEMLEQMAAEIRKDLQDVKP